MLSIGGFVTANDSSFRQLSVDGFVGVIMEPSLVDTTVQTKEDLLAELAGERFRHSNVVSAKSAQEKTASSQGNRQGNSQGSSSHRGGNTTG